MKSPEPKRYEYKPSEKKRYEVSADDEFSRERMRALKDIRGELERELGVPLSFSIIGSLVKGKKLFNKDVASSADIDLFIDIDKEAFDHLGRNGKVEIIKKTGKIMGIDEEKLKNTEKNFAEFPESIIEEIVKANFEELLTKKLEKRKDALGSPKTDIGVRTVNLEKIKQAINSYLNNKPPKTKEDVETTVLKLLQREVNIAGYFTLSIGTVVKKYRNQFLAELAGNSDQVGAEKTWEEIREVIERVERESEIPKNLKKQFPQTLEKALVFYGVKRKSDILAA